jgi:putative CocE/NonD family hydrolase
MKKNLVLATVVLTLLLTRCGQPAAYPTAPLVPTVAATATEQVPASTPTDVPTVSAEPSAAAVQSGRISRFGEYEGYSEPRYDGQVLTSQHVEMRDGTLLAVDIYRPTQNGTVVEEPLPVIWMHTRYLRRNIHFEPSGGLFLTSYGYVTAAVDARGSGASFGIRKTEFTPEEAQDAYDITEWFAAQPWCDGNVGMFSRSYMGIAQFFAAAQAPPHLKAIFPEMHLFDLYDLPYKNGIYNHDFLEKWDASVRHFDNMTGGAAMPVDEDGDGSMLASAIALRAQNGYPFDLSRAAPYRDSLFAPGVGEYAVVSPATYIDEINASGVAVYQLGSWYDEYTLDPLLWFANLHVPQKLVMPGWNHDVFEPWLNVEKLRWFDYWLKGIDNGIMDEPPLRYYVMGAPEDEAWRTADRWPLPNEERTAFYFHAGPSRSVPSVNDGLLMAQLPTEVDDHDDYVVDYTTTVGPTNRFANGYGAPFGYPDMAANDTKALTYTTLPLESDVEVTGHPVVLLWVSSTAADGDFFAYLEEVDEDGVSTYITEGKLRASFRTQHVPPYENMDLPWHRCWEEDVEPLPQGQPAELVFDLLPTSNLFDAGHRIRVTITGADDDTYETPQLDPAPTVSIYRGSEYASYIELPIIPAE